MRQYRITGLNVKHKDEKIGKIEEIGGEVRFGDTLAECVSLAGGESQARDALNASTVRAVKQAIRSRAANAPDNDTPEAFANDVAKYFQEAIPSAGRIGPTVATVKNFAEEMRERQAKGEEVTPESLFARAKELGII